MAGTVTIGPESPLAADLGLLFDRHRDFCHADTPPDSIHMMDRAALTAPDISFHVLREAGRPVAMGAIKRLGGGLGEIKSMHVLTEARGRGLAQRMLDHLLATAAAEGLTRLSLETGAQPSFAPARALYAAAGFVDCPPFGDYRPDPMSVFMTRAIAPTAG